MRSFSILVRSVRTGTAVIALMAFTACSNTVTPDQAAPTPAPPLIPTSNPQLSIAAGALHHCRVDEIGEARCWGSNQYGQLGQGDTLYRGDDPNELASTPDIDLGPGSVAQKLVAGFGHTCALLVGGSVKCWGDNQYGQLGLGDAYNRGDFVGEMGGFLPAVDLGNQRHAIDLAAGWFHTCAILDNGTVKCWGLNTYGQLGLGDAASRGDETGEMGDFLPPVFLGTGRRAKSLAAGTQHTCALLDDSSVKCWGLNDSGQLGQGHVSSLGDAPGEMAALAAIQLGTGRKARAISTGAGFSCAVLDNGTAKCWGDNSLGQLGQDDTSDRGDAPGEMGDALNPIHFGTGLGVRSLSSGVAHNCAILTDATLRCFGDGADGRLGQGSTNDIGDSAFETASIPAVELGTGRRARAIATSAGSTCVILDNDQIKCWGDNFFGQLGIGDAFDRGDNGGEMGNSLPALEF